MEKLSTSKKKEDKVSYLTFKIKTMTTTGTSRTIICKYLEEELSLVAMQGVGFRNDDEEIECLNIPGTFYSAETDKTYDIKNISSFILKDSNLFPHHIKKLIIGKGIESLAECAFVYAKVHFVELESIREIGIWSFKESAIESITIKNPNVDIISFGAFFNCIKLKKVILPKDCKQISSFAFGSCISLKYITWPAKCDLIPLDCFTNCRNLKKIKIKNQKISIDDDFDSTQITELDLSQTFFCCVSNATNSKHIKINKPLYGTLVYKE